MSKIKLLPHQQLVIDETTGCNNVAYYLDMGLGKTFVGSEKMKQLDEKVNLLICQKSKIQDWMDHFNKYYDYHVFDLTNKKHLEQFLWEFTELYDCLGIINYELAWRRKQLLELHDFTLMLDESSLIQNETAKQTKFILKMKPSNVILLSGTPTSGKYENLWTQGYLLGWDISKSRYDSTYINWTLTPDDGSGMRHKIVDKNDPYKNVERLKSKLREHGAVFMKTEEVLDLPEQNFIPVMVDAPKTYKKFMKDDYVCITLEGEDGGPIPVELIATTSLTKRLYARQLCSQYNNNKLDAVTDLIQSTQDRLIIFYNFTEELNLLKGICEILKRPYSEVNGSVKDLFNYENEEDSVTLVQYQAGAMGLNLQNCNKIIYFSLPERSELFEQSKKRIHRIGQEKPCFYYILLAKNTIDEQIKCALDMKKDFTDELFVKNT